MWQLDIVPLHAALRSLYTAAKVKGKDAGFSPTFAALFLPESLLFEDISHSVELTGSDTETSVTWEP